MSRLILHRLEAVPPDRLARIGEELLRRMAGGEAEPVLVVAQLCDQAVLLGRHQRAASALALDRVAAARLPVARRLGGGRAILAGQGTVGVLLALPSASSLLPERIGEEKVLNRHCRGLLRGLTALAGQPVAYFGRDFLSAMGGPAGSRQVATVSQEGAPGGAVLVEALVPVSRSLALPAELGGYPAHGDPRAAGPAHGTLAQLAGRTPEPDQVVEAIAAGFAEAHHCEVVHADLQLLPVGQPIFPPPLEEEAGLEESGVSDIAIGFAEALVRHDGERVLEARLRGDFLTPAFVLRGLEESCRGSPLTFAELGTRVNAAFATPHAMSSGLTTLRVLADAVLAAAGKLGA